MYLQDENNSIGSNYPGLILILDLFLFKMRVIIKTVLNMWCQLLSLTHLCLYLHVELKNPISPVIFFDQY